LPCLTYGYFLPRDKQAITFFIPTARILTRSVSVDWLMQITEEQPRYDIFLSYTHADAALANDLHILVTPNSKDRSWVIGESGGAWALEKRVILIKGY
jgi:hypothetical protein